jgi:hypothetical protein
VQLIKEREFIDAPPERRQEGNWSFRRHTFSTRPISTIMAAAADCPKHNIEVSEQLHNLANSLASSYDAYKGYVPL